MPPSAAAAAASADLDAIAAEVFATLGAGRQIAPFTSRPAGLPLGAAYRVSAKLNALRERRGERRRGRKIGFTNRTIWAQYGVYAPIWGHVYDTTVHDLADTPVLPLDAFAEPRIEPEIVFGLRAAPAPDMDEAALVSCLDWVAHGFEIVQSIYPQWTFAAPDTIACNGLHGALLIGTRHAIAPRAQAWRDRLPHFAIDLFCNGDMIDRGRAANVMEGPVSALRYLAVLLAGDTDNPPLAAGEIVTTGTLTRAMPVKAGETWTTALRDIPLDGISLRFT